MNIKGIHKEWHDMESLWLHKIIVIVKGEICSWYELSDIERTEHCSFN